MGIFKLYILPYWQVANPLDYIRHMPQGVLFALRGGVRNPCKSPKCGYIIKIEVIKLTYIVEKKPVTRNIATIFTHIFFYPGRNGKVVCTACRYISQIGALFKGHKAVYGVVHCAVSAAANHYIRL